MSMVFVGESSIGRALAWLDEDGVPQLGGSRCPQCGLVSIPARVRCSEDLSVCEPYIFAGTGTVYAIVKVSLAPQGFEAPFWAAYVDLDEGARLFAQVAEGDDGRSPVAGDRVTVTVTRLAERDGEDVIGPLFQVAGA
jgi:uncharacterized OB-fold protein